MLTNRYRTLVVALWGGLFLSPRAAEPMQAGVSHGDAGSALYAYYTALDYTIPLSEIRMNVPFSNEEQVQAWRKVVENDTPRNAPQPENPVMKVGTACPNFGGMFKGSLEAVGTLQFGRAQLSLVEHALCPLDTDSLLVTPYVHLTHSITIATRIDTARRPPSALPPPTDCHPWTNSTSEP